MIRYTLRPISELITDHAIAKNVDQAVTDYAGGAASACAAEHDQVKALNGQVGALNGEVNALNDKIAQNGLYGGAFMQYFSDSQCSSGAQCWSANPLTSACSCPAGFTPQKGNCASFHGYLAPTGCVKKN